MQSRRQKAAPVRRPNVVLDIKPLSSASFGPSASRVSKDAVWKDLPSELSTKRLHLRSESVNHYLAALFLTKLRLKLLFKITEI